MKELDEIRQRIEQLEKEGLPMNHNSRNDLLVFVGICFTAILLSCFLLTLIGVIDLRIVNEIQVEPWIDNLGNFIMIMLNMFFVFSITMLRIDKNIFIVWALYSIIIYGFVLLDMPLNIFSSGIVPCIYVLTWAYFLNNLRNSFKIIVILTIILSIEISLFNFIKFGFNHMIYIYNPNILVKIIYSIDLYIAYIILLAISIYYKNKIKEMLNYDSVEVFIWVFRFLKTSCKKIIKNVLTLTPEEQEKNHVDVLDMNELETKIYCNLTWAYTLTQSIFIVVGSRLINKLFYYLGFPDIAYGEIIICILALEISRRILGKTYHNKNPLICNSVSLLVIGLMSRLILPLQISLFVGVSISVIFAFIIHVIVVKNDIVKETELKLQEHIENEKNRELFVLRKGCDREKLMVECKYKNLSERDTNILIWWYADDLGYKEIAQKGNIYNKHETSLRNYLRQAERNFNI